MSNTQVSKAKKWFIVLSALSLLVLVVATATIAVLYIKGQHSNNPVLTELVQENDILNKKWGIEPVSLIMPESSSHPWEKSPPPYVVSKYAYTALDREALYSKLTDGLEQDGWRVLSEDAPTRWVGYLPSGLESLKHTTGAYADLKLIISLNESDPGGSVDVQSSQSQIEVILKPW